MNHGFNEVVGGGDVSLGGLEGDESGENDGGGDERGENGGEEETADLEEVFFDFAPVLEEEGVDEVEDGADADDVCHVILNAENGGEGEDVEAGFAVHEQFINAEKNEGEPDDAVKEHGVGGEGGVVKHEGVGGGEDDGFWLRGDFEMFGEEDESGESDGADFEQGDDEESGGFGGDDEVDEVEWAEEVVGGETEEVATENVVETVEEVVVVKEDAFEIGEKWDVLTFGVVGDDGVFAEGPDAAFLELAGEEEEDDGEEECKKV